MSFTSDNFRAAMACFATGVTVVTTTLDQLYFGLTVNAFCSVSLHPPLTLISLDLAAQTYPVLRRSGIFGVNILAQEQKDLAKRFAHKDRQARTFEDIPLKESKTGVPLFVESLACIECHVVAEYPGGDHALILGKVVNVELCLERLEQGPLLYYRSAFGIGQETDVLRQQPTTIGVTRTNL